MLRSRMHMLRALSRRWQPSVQRLSLVLLVVQNSALVMVMHHSRTSPTGNQPRYYASTAVLLVEVIKLLASLVLAVRQTVISHPDAQPSEVLTHLYHSIFSPDSWKLIVPAALYTLQNSLVYTAVSNLDAVTFQVTYQLKILTTVLFSILLLGRTVSPRQWLALLFLTLGVALVQISGQALTIDWLGRLTALIKGDTLAVSPPNLNAVKGLTAVLTASLISGLTCVYFEKLIKDSPSPTSSLWTRNIQLSLFSLFPALFIGVLWRDGAAIARDGFFAGYNGLVWATVALQALGGLVVAVCIAYADNVAKNFAASWSIVLSYGVGACGVGGGGGGVVTGHATVGAAIVILATYLFNSKPAARGVLLPVGQERVSREKSRSSVSELTILPMNKS